METHSTTFVLKTYLTVLLKDSLKVQRTNVLSIGKLFSKQENKQMKQVTLHNNQIACKIQGIYPNHMQSNNSKRWRRKRITSCLSPWCFRPVGLKPIAVLKTHSLNLQFFSCTVQLTSYSGQNGQLTCPIKQLYCQFQRTTRLSQIVNQSPKDNFLLFKASFSLDSHRLYKFAVTN